MSTKNILIAGFGGQGVLFAGKFLAYAGLLLDQQEILVGFLCHNACRSHFYFGQCR